MGGMSLCRWSSAGGRARPRVHPTPDAVDWSNAGSWLFNSETVRRRALAAHPELRAVVRQSGFPSFAKPS